MGKPKEKEEGEAKRKVRKRMEKKHARIIRDAERG